MTRGRRPLVRPTRSLHLHIDAELADLIDSRLWSEAEQRIPKGAYQAFFAEAAVRMLRQLPLDLSPFLSSLPQEHVVYAYGGTREVLLTHLTKDRNGHDPRDANEDCHVAG